MKVSDGLHSDPTTSQLLGNHPVDNPMAIKDALRNRPHQAVLPTTINQFNLVLGHV